MSQPYGYTNYSQPRGSQPFDPSRALAAHERGEAPDYEQGENDEGDEMGDAGIDPLRLAVLRLLMQREGGR